MEQTLTYKILAGHLVEGKMASGEEIGIRIDQTLTQDATGTTAFLLFESMGAGRVKTAPFGKLCRPQYSRVRA